MGVFKLKKRKVCIVLTTRGNYAKMKSVILEINQRQDLELQIIIGGMVALEKYGRLLQTIKDEIELVVDRTINFVIEGESLTAMAKSSGIAVSEFSTAFEELKPDIVLVIADRFECLPIAMAAAYMNITVAHIEGGEVSGSIDESIRHAITKLSHIHLPASLDAANRIEKMGESSESIFHVGGTSMDVIRELNLEDLDPVRLYQTEYGMGPVIDIVPKKYLILIQHPVTTEYLDNFRNVNETIEAIKLLKIPTIWVMPNMDAGANSINKAVRRFREAESPENIHFFKSLPIEYYAPLLKNAACILGNSSSGIRESAFLGTPTVNIGTRQNGRERGKNVVDVGYDRGQIVSAVKSQIAHGSYEPDYIFGDGFASKKIVDVLSNCSLSIQKTITY